MPKLQMNEIKVDGYEKVVEIQEPKSGLHAFIAIHSTKLGQTLGGTRMYPYASSAEALEDVLRLSQGMTYKSAVSMVGFGGAKSVIIGNPHTDKTPELLKAFAMAVDSLNGLYICAEDSGTTTDDMKLVSEYTPYVCGLHGGSGDPSRFTAWGVYRGIEATCQHMFGSRSVEGRTVAIQGIGAVGRRLSEILFWHGARVIIADTHKKREESLLNEIEAKVVDPQAIYSVDCDIFAPCAMGAVINDETLPKLRCKIVAGGANNVLHKPKHGQELKEKGILYAPDFVINSGGLINAASEFNGPYSAAMVKEKVDALYDVLLDIFSLADKERISTHEASVKIALKHIEQGIGKRAHPVKFK